MVNVGIPGRVLPRKPPVDTGTYVVLDRINAIDGENGHDTVVLRHDDVVRIDDGTVSAADMVKGFHETVADPNGKAVFLKKTDGVNAVEQKEVVAAAAAAAAPMLAPAPPAPAPAPYVPYPPNVGRRGRSRGRSRRATRKTKGRRTSRRNNRRFYRLESI